MTWAVHVSLAPTWFDRAETSGIITPFMVLYAIHDAPVKPMPGNAMAPSLAESWTMSKDGLVYEFALRKGVRFHGGETMTAEDVKFSFERYRGASASDLKAKVARVDVVDPYRVRFTVKRPWPDFMTFYATPATGAAWIVPKKYVEQVGDMIYGTAIGEPVVNYLQTVGIRVQLRPIERAAFFKELGEKMLRYVVQNGSGAPGTAPMRIEVNAVTGGRYAYGA
jgi:ABC-type transport system substrate-binding protein